MTKKILLIIMIFITASCATKKTISENDKFKESYVASCVEEAKDVLGEKYCSCTYDEFVKKYGLREFVKLFFLISKGEKELTLEDEAIIEKCILYDYGIGEIIQKQINF